MIFKVCAIALISVFTAVLLRELGMRGIGIFSAVCGAVILSLCADMISDAASQIKELSLISGLGDTASDILKIVGIGYVFGFCSDMCSDLGEGGISNTLNIAGRLEILGISLPYFKKIIEFGLSLIK